jgi:hypothetical protein
MLLAFALMAPFIYLKYSLKCLLMFRTPHAPPPVSDSCPLLLLHGITTSSWVSSLTASLCLFPAPEEGARPLMASMTSLLRDTPRVLINTSMNILESFIF